MSDLMKFTKDHEWVRVEDGVATCGITAYAAEQLGDVVYVDLPRIGRVVDAGGDMAVVESAKAASDVYAPVSGKIVAVNDALADAPEQVNAGPQGEGWFCKIALQDADELDDLMSAAEYQAFLEGQS